MTSPSRRTGNPDLFPELEIPRATVLSWVRRGVRAVLSLDTDREVEAALRARIVRLEHRAAMPIAVLQLVLALLRISGFKLEHCRVADESGKRLLLGALERARKAMPLWAALRALRLSAARYHAWVRAEETCTLDDRPSCPRTMPQRLTHPETTSPR